MYNMCNVFMLGYLKELNLVHIFNLNMYLTFFLPDLCHTGHVISQGGTFSVRQYILLMLAIVIIVVIIIEDIFDDIIILLLIVICHQCPCHLAQY